MAKSWDWQAKVSTGWRGARVELVVFTKEGKFLKEFILAPTTGVGGSTGGVMFSPDKQQRLLYISDLPDNHIWFLHREDGKVMGQMGSMCENGGNSSACT